MKKQRINTTMFGFDHWIKNLTPFGYTDLFPVWPVADPHPQTSRHGFAFGAGYSESEGGSFAFNHSKPLKPARERVFFDQFTQRNYVPPMFVTENARQNVPVVHFPPLSDQINPFEPFASSVYIDYFQRELWRYVNPSQRYV